MRIAPIVLILVGTVGVAKHLGLISAGALHLLGPLLLIGIGLALLFRRPRMGCGHRHGRTRPTVADASKAPTATAT